MLIKGLNGGVGAAEAQKVHVSILAETILELSESGTVLLE